MSDLYCKNYKCPHNKPLDKPISFKFSELYVPFVGDACKGACSKQFNGFKWFDKIVGSMRYEGAECMYNDLFRSGIACDRADCIHNSTNSCKRDSILVDSLEGNWLCKCYSQAKIRGHWDWSRFPQGGSIDDAYSEKLHKDKNTFKSYNQGHHEGK